jgi:hypothetical protein
MPLDPHKVHTYSIRRPKVELPIIRQLANALKTSPARMMNEAFQAHLPRLMKKAGIKT